MTFFERLKSRKVVQWTVGYTAVAIGILQSMDALGGGFSVPPILQRSIIVLLVTGFFATVILAWYHGEKGHQKVSNPELALLASVFAAGATALWLVGPPSTEAAPGRAEPAGRGPSAPTSIAVLAFENLDEVEADLPLGVAIQDEVLNQLVRVPGLSPISRTSMVALRDVRLNARQLGDSLDVRNVVEGTFQRAGDRVKVVARLIETDRGSLVWSEDRTFRLADPFEFQREVATWVVGRVVTSLLKTAAPDIHAHGPLNAQAYEAFLDGQTFTNSRTREGLQLAMDAFKHAIQLDSVFAPPYASLAFAHTLWNAYGYGGSEAGYQAFGRALALAERAVDLDWDFAEAYSTRANLLTRAYAPADTVEPGFLTAIELAPASAEVRILYAHFLTRERRYEEAIREASLAVRLDPKGPGRVTGLSWNWLAAGKPERAFEWARKAAALEPSLTTPRVISALALVLMGRGSECLSLELGTYAAIRAICLDAIGRSDEARAIADSVAARPPTGAPGQHLATYYAWIGDAPRALEALRSGFSETPHGLDFRVIHSPVFRRAHEDPSFVGGLDRLTKEVWERAQRQRAMGIRFIAAQ